MAIQQNPNAVISNPAPPADPDPLNIDQQAALLAAQQAEEFAAVTNASIADQERLEKYQTGSIVDFTDINQSAESFKNIKPILSKRTVPGVAEGAESIPPLGTTVTIFDRKGNKRGNDLRVKIKVPPKYLDGLAQPLSLHQGILFPYTPAINYEFKADYGTSNPLHSNFTIYFYQRSSIGPININAKFTIENEDDAIIFAATIHCLKSLTRMRFGGAKYGDIDSGAPPPVCRLSGYGNGGLDNVPVVIQNFRLDLPDSVDYFTFRSPQDGPLNTDYIGSFPTLSMLNITCLPVFSRSEMQEFSVSKYLNGGFLGRGII